MPELEEFDPGWQLRTATRRAKSDVANKLVSMFLHVLSRRLCEEWQLKIEDESYMATVKEIFEGRCPYCRTELNKGNVIVEHPDGMNRLRAGLHVPGNVLLACKPCNSEKRRDDSLRLLVLAQTSWEFFLSLVRGVIRPVEHVRIGSGSGRTQPNERLHCNKTRIESIASARFIKSLGVWCLI